MGVAVPNTRPDRIVSRVLLTSAEVVPYLRGRRVLGAATGTDLPPAVARNARRNLIFTVDAGPKSGYFLKQGVDEEREAGIAREAAIYAWLGSGNGDGFERYLPDLVDHDPERHVIVLERVAEGSNLRSYHARGHFSTTLARVLGEALASLHRLAVPDRSTTSVKFEETPPWALSVHRPGLNVLLHASSANVEMIRTLQQHRALGEHLDALRKGWRPKSLIHNDVRWDNCVVHPKKGARRRSRLKLVDWELAQRGDPLWDVGCVLSDYLSFWLLSIPTVGEAPPDRFLALARYPLTAMQPAIRAFWQAYLHRDQPSEGEAAVWLELAIRYAAARLIQTGFERTQTTSFLTASVVGLLQLSRNILEEPDAAAVDLLGIDVGERSR